MYYTVVLYGTGGRLYTLTIVLYMIWNSEPAELLQLLWTTVRSQCCCSTHVKQSCNGSAAAQPVYYARGLQTLHHTRCRTGRLCTWRASLGGTAL
jgi:hypothetical protein